METLALDVYGTLINPHAIAARLAEHLGERGDDFSQLWRSKQLEFSFRRGLMGAYADFSIVTRDALEYTNATLDAQLTDSAKEALGLAPFSTSRTNPSTKALFASVRENVSFVLSLNTLQRNHNTSDRSVELEIP